MNKGKKNKKKKRGNPKVRHENRMAKQQEASTARKDQKTKDYLNQIKEKNERKIARDKANNPYNNLPSEMKPLAKELGIL